MCCCSLEDLPVKKVWWRGLCHAGVVGFLCLPAARRLCALNVVSQCSVDFAGETFGVVIHLKVALLLLLRFVSVGNSSCRPVHKSVIAYDI